MHSNKNSFIASKNEVCYSIGLENPLAVSYKYKHRLTIETINSTPRNLFNYTENLYSFKLVYANV